VINADGNVKLVPKNTGQVQNTFDDEDEEDWEKIRKEFDRIDPKGMVPVDGDLAGNPRLVEGVLKEFGIKRTPREFSEFHKSAITVVAWVFGGPFFYGALAWLFPGVFLDNEKTAEDPFWFRLIMSLILFGIGLFIFRGIYGLKKWLYED